MNPHRTYSTSLLAIARSIWQNRSLTVQMIKRDIISSYKGSFMGLFWSFINPILMLAVYTFVFTVVFKARWGVGGDESMTDFAVVLFVGLIIHSIFAEILNRAPGLILGNVNYVKKVIFPLEILPIIALGGALFRGLVSLVVLLTVFVLLNGFIHWTAIFVPLVILPFVLVMLGFAWLLASIGVYLRDIEQATGFFATMMLFLAPVFYPVSILPEKYQILILANPLTFIIEQARQVMLFGKLPNLQGLAVYSVVSLGVAWFGYWWFQKTRKGVADVV